EVEVMANRGAAGLAAFLDERAGHYQRIFVSRPHNLALLQTALKRDRPPIVYDAEAIFADRDAQELALEGRPMPDAERRRRVAGEIDAARRAGTVTAVSELDRARFAAGGARRTFTLGHALVPAPAP